MLGTLLGIGGSILSGVLGSRSGGAQADAGAAQAALGNRIADYADPFITQGQQANTELLGFLGMGDNPQDTAGLQSHQLGGANALNSGANPFAAHNFVDGLEQGQQIFDYDRTFGEYNGSNAKQANDQILAKTMADYSNSVMGSSLSGKALDGAMGTASRTNAELQGGWAAQQLASQQNSITSGRQGIQSDVNFRQQAFNNMNTMAQRGTNSIAAAAGGAQIASQGLQNQAAGRQQQYAAWGNAFGNGLSAARQGGWFG